MQFFNTGVTGAGQNVTPVAVPGVAPSLADLEAAARALSACPQALAATRAQVAFLQGQLRAAAERIDFLSRVVAFMRPRPPGVPPGG